MSAVGYIFFKNIKEQRKRRDFTAFCHLAVGHKTNKITLRQEDATLTVL